MPQFNQARIQDLAIHYVGNQNNGGKLILSDKLLSLSDETLELLGLYFFKTIKSESLYEFDTEKQQESSLSHIVQEVFNNPYKLLEHSKQIATMLFDLSLHPQIKSGELFVAYIDNCIVDNENTDAIGIFKSENKDTFLKVFEKEGQFDVKADKGINIHKVDKACIIYNTAKGGSYLISIEDFKRESGEAALYWKDEFINAKLRNDNFSNTSNFLNLYKGFFNEVADSELEIDKKEKTKMNIKAKEFFETNESFDSKKFEKEVIGKPEYIESFREYKDDFQNANHIEIIDEFDISSNVVKKNKNIFKNIIKLDRNFHIYVHGNHEKIERGFDKESGQKFYKLYYENES